MSILTATAYPMREDLPNPTGPFGPSGNRQTCLLGAGLTVLTATQNSPKSGE